MSSHDLNVWMLFVETMDPFDGLIGLVPFTEHGACPSRLPFSFLKACSVGSTLRGAPSCRWPPTPECQWTLA
ncbi:hypothetical protein IUS99_03325 [Mycobacteroides abscessus subsp. massiliense]|uniref:hypothetical protein n=1 Tax=Mycobacteroides abscessus TaxID=36809 RepID=UPI0019D287D9|nr:hypothetical protein [Mycobacteroides abscessus]MBN7315791.1 hypothetical protein [Mycobacteroides abscessus subsp. massiliense]